MESQQQAAEQSGVLMAVIDKPKRGRKKTVATTAVAAPSVSDIMTLVQQMQQTSQRELLGAVAHMVQEMKKPYVDEALKAREKREAAKTKADMERIAEVRRIAQSRCSHKYKKSGVWAIALVHNYPDRQTRGHCNLCKLDIEPERWEIAYDPMNPAGKPTKMPAHPLYHVIREIESEHTWDLVG